VIPVVGTEPSPCVLPGSVGRFVVFSALSHGCMAGPQPKKQKEMKHWRIQFPPEPHSLTWLLSGAKTGPGALES